ncbi:MAG: beta strand repeat-containing protein, partial [Limisphaerales bacterium]
TWGDGSAGTTWDLLYTMDWLNGASPWAFTNGDSVTFNDTGSPTVNLQTALRPGSVTVTNTVTYTFADGTGSGGGKISGATGVTKSGTGTLIIQTANNNNGPTVINAGTVQVGNGGIGDLGLGNVTNNGALIFAQGDNAVHIVPGVISGTGSLTQQGSSTVVLAHGGSYSGATTISSGALQIGNGGTVGSLPTGSVTDSSTLIFNSSGSISLPGDISGSGSLANIGSGNVTFTGSLAYQGDTYISNGVVKLTANDQIPDANSVSGSTGWLILDGGNVAGTFDLNGFSETINALSGLSGTMNGIIANSGASATTTNTLTILNAATTTYNGWIFDKGGAGSKTALFVTGPGTLTLNPLTNNTFSGGMTISNSTVALGSPINASGNPAESAYAPGTGPITLLGTNASLVLAGSAGSSTTPTYNPLINTIIIPDGQTGTVYGPCRGANNGNLLGGGTLYYDSTYVRGSVGGDWSAFTGHIILSGDSTGGNIGLNVTNGLPNAVLEMNTNVTLYGTVGGTPTIPIGALVGGDSSCQIESTSSGNAGGAATIFAIGGLNTSTSYEGGIVDNVGLLKVGTGTFTLDGGEMLTTNITLNGLFYETNISYGTNMIIYTGSTTISDGVLALVVPIVLTNSTSVTLASATAVLDASSMGYISNQYDSDGVTVTNQLLVTNGVFEVVSGQTLAGIGTIRASNVLADAGSIVNAGLPTGTLAVTGGIELGGAVNINISATNAPNSGEISAPSITVDSTATLTVTNLGPEVGATFHLFSQAVDTNKFVSITLPTLTGTNSWQNNLAVDGTITLVAPPLVNLTPTNIVASVSGGNLTLSWPADHVGWHLQTQTNSLDVGISTNWVDVPGAELTNQVTIPINPTNGAVFFRMTY